MRNKIIFGLLLAFVVACKNDKPVLFEEEILDIQEDATISSIGITLSPTAKNAVAIWSKYTLVQNKMQMYQSITKSQALQNAIELSELIKDASDTIDIPLLDRPDLKMRFNVLYNHAYRLHDMGSITNITDEEVVDEIARLLNAFSSVNDKINVVYTIQDYKSEFGNATIDTAIFNSRIELSDEPISTTDNKVSPMKDSNFSSKNRSNSSKNIKGGTTQKKQLIPSKETSVKPKSQSKQLKKRDSIISTKQLVKPLKKQ